MSIIAVDLAARYSAAVWMTAILPVIAEWDSATTPEQSFLQQCCGPFEDDIHPDQLVVEDLPHGVAFRGLVKRVCQLQGRIAERMDDLGKLDRLVFVTPATWRNSYPELRKRGQGADAVISLAVEHGYVPPDNVALYGPRGGTALARKVQSDYCAAFLIGLWALKTHVRYGSYDVPGTNRYAHPTIRKDARVEG